MTPELPLGRRRSAILSPDRFYRYELRHEWDDRLPALYVGALNPSTADAETDDSTVRKLVGFSVRLRLGSFVLWNLFAWRATDPRDLWSAIDPIGPENDGHLMRIFDEVRRTPGARFVLAWGAHASGRGRRVGDVLRMVRSAGIADRAECWGRTTHDLEPRHPLMLAYATPLEAYRLP